MRSMTPILLLAMGLVTPGLLQAQILPEPADTTRYAAALGEQVALSGTPGVVPDRDHAVQLTRDMRHSPGLTGAAVGAVGDAVAGGIEAWNMGAAGADVAEMTLMRALTGAATGFAIDLTIHRLKRWWRGN